MKELRVFDLLFCSSVGVCVKRERDELPAYFCIVEMCSSNHGHLHS